MIVHSIDFTFTWRASSKGDTESKSITILFKNFIHQCTFSRTWRSHYCQRLEEGFLGRKMLVEYFWYLGTLDTFCGTYSIIDFDHEL